MIVSLGIGHMPYKEIAALTGARCTAELPQNTFPSRLVTHSQEVASGDIFCALHGKTDGHAFIEEAISRGASAVLAETVPHPSLPALLVKDTNEALGAWAKGALLNTKITVVAITGSVGKTMTKDAINTVLSQVHKTHATHQNQNNAIGVPFTILSAPKDTEILIAECGTNSPGEIAYLSSLLLPDVSVITCIGHAHIGAFGSREAIAKEKLSLLRHAKKGGCALLPYGEPLTALIPPNGIKRIAVKSSANVLRMPHVPNADSALIMALSYAEATAITIKMSSQSIRNGLQKAVHLSRRICTEEKGVKWIDDSYNASPESVYGALVYLSSEKGRKIAVLGDMAELGEQTEALHRAMGKMAAMHADLVFFFGEFASFYAQGARTASTAAEIVFCDTACTQKEIASTILPYIKQGDSILFKASHALHAEKILYQLKEMYIP